MKEPNTRSIAAACGMLLVLALIVLTPAGAVAHTVTPPQEPPPQPQTPADIGTGTNAATNTGTDGMGSTPADTGQAQPMDIDQPLDETAPASGRYWAAYVLLGLMLAALAFSLFIAGRTVFART